LGYIAGAKMAEAFHGWQWALRVSATQQDVAVLLTFYWQFFSQFFILD